MNYRYTLSLLIAAFCSLNVQAASTDRWFDVEILIFKRNVDVQEISEQLDQNNVHIQQQKRLEVLKAKQVTDCLAGQPCLHEKNPVKITNNEMIIGGHRLQRLGNSHLKLKKQLRSLERHRLFKPLMHAAWRMPIKNKRTALPIHLFAGENYALAQYQKERFKQKTNNIPTPDDINTISLYESETNNNIQNNLDANLTLKEEDLMQDLFEIDGNLLIYVERYLYVDSQLVVRTQTEKTVSSIEPAFINTENRIELEASDAVEIVAQESIVQKRIKTKTVTTETLFDQSRRLRSEEIHYLDHPLFGVIIQIRKIP